MSILLIAAYVSAQIYPFTPWLFHWNWVSVEPSINKRPITTKQTKLNPVHI